MKYLPIITFASLLFIGSCSAQKKTVQRADDLKTEAKTFSLSVVKSYFKSDCDKVYTAISDSILLVGRDIVLIKGQSKTLVKDIGTDVSRHMNKENICVAVKKSIKDKTKSYSDYLNTYDPLIFTRSELEELLTKKRKKLSEKFITKPDDLFFLGMKLKDGFDSSKDFIWDDMFFLMVRKEKDTWKIKAFTD